MATIEAPTPSRFTYPDLTVSELPKKPSPEEVHAKAEAAVRASPYNPILRVHLCEALYDLNWPSQQAYCAYIAILLIQIFQHRTDVQKFLAIDPVIRHWEQIEAALIDYYACTYGIEAPSLGALMYEGLGELLDETHSQAYKHLLTALSCTMAMRDGLAQAKVARKSWPEDPDFKLIEDNFREGFLQYIQDLNEDRDMSAEAKKARGGTGWEHKKRLPWMDCRLIDRSPELLRAVNVKLAKLTDLVHIRSLFDTGDADDVGPLGAFAIRDIPAGTTLFLDKTSTAVSNISATKLQNCENCHASLHVALIPARKVVVAPCCRAAAYCSHTCATTARGYHQLNCGKDLRFLYDNVTSSPLRNSTWEPLLLHRILSIIRVSELGYAGPAKHPLEHELVSRLTAGYQQPSSTSLPASRVNWSLFSHVVAPISSLATLGINPFTNFAYSGCGETISTLYQRIDNNAAKTLTTVVKDGFMVDNQFKEIIPTPNIPLSHLIQPTTINETRWELSGIYPNFMFFNHGCKANVEWNAVGGHSDYSEVAITEEGDEARGNWVINGLGRKEWIPQGASTLMLKTCRDVKAGEELSISYVPEGHEGGLEKWFEGGCLCAHCRAKDSAMEDVKGDLGESEMDGVA